MNRPPHIILTIALTLAGLMAMTASHAEGSPAGTNRLNHTTNPARACQLSVPTTDTRMRPRASGFRNEGSTPEYVICGMENLDYTEMPIYFFGLALSSTDGATHTINCTGVTGVQAQIQYSSKTIAIPSEGIVQPIWIDGDFGASGQVPNASSMSVTCLLPPGVSILSVNQGGDLNVSG